MKKLGKNLLIYLLLAYIAVLGGMYFGQRNFIYVASQKQITPAQLGHPEMKVVHVTTEDGLKLEGWQAAPRDKNKPTIIFFHGNADHHAYTVYRLEPYLEKGYGVLLTEYRGYAGNPGKPTEDGIYKDARAWVKSLLDAGIKPQDIILMGQSLGTGVAVQMAVEHPDMRALILQSPYTTLPNVAQQTYFFLPVQLLMKDRYASVDKIGKVHMPVFIINGKRDMIVPAKQGEALYNATNQPKDFVQLPQYGHNDMPVGETAAHVEKFLDGLTQNGKKPK